jgi:fibronectin-binding autotransporter adhesin
VKTGPGAQVLSTPTAGANTYTGDTVIQEGVLRLNASNLIPDGPAAGNMTLTGGVGTGVFDLNGNSETLNGLHGSSGSTVTSNGVGTATLTVGGTATPATSATFAGTIRDNTDGGSGVLNFTKLTASTQILSGTNTYSGATTVSAGTLLVNGSLANTSSVTVAGGATLGGNGSINSNVTINGNLAPGNSPGTLAITGTLDLPSTATLNWEINNLDQTVGLSINDLVIVTGNLLLDGTLNVSSAGSFAGITSGKWRLFDYTGTLTDNELTLGTMPTLDAGIDWELDVSTPNQVDLKIIPEASIALLLGLGSFGLALRRRRA